MLNNKKAQIGETVTWIIATLVIVVVLGISIVATNFLFGSNNSNFYQRDKQKDLFATESISNFLRDSENLETIKSFDENSDKVKLEKFLKTIPGPLTAGFGGWNAQIGEIEVNTFRIVINPLDRYNYFEMIFTSDGLNFKFWMECDGTCK